MTIQSLTYQDLPAAKRRVSANKTLQRLREQLSNSALSLEQVLAYKAQMERVEKWAAGTLELPSDSWMG
jgi:hypothetical protein